MLDEAPVIALPPGDDRSPPRGLPPDAPLAMPAQVLERRDRLQAGWSRLMPVRAS